MPSPVPQAGVLAIHAGRVCLVTSSSGRRWVIPKGQIDPGHTPPQAAEIEAWEEAGLCGSLEAGPVGNYDYVKFGRDFRVTVYVMTVAEIRDQYPERGLRRRVWLSAAEAIERVDEPGLKSIIRQVFGLPDPSTTPRAPGLPASSS